MDRVTITLGRAHQIQNALIRLLQAQDMAIELAFGLSENSLVIDQAVEVLKKLEQEVYEKFAERQKDGACQIDPRGLPMLRLSRKDNGDLDLDEAGKPKVDVEAAAAWRQGLESVHARRIRINIKPLALNLFPRTVEGGTIKCLMPLLEGYCDSDQLVELLGCDDPSPPKRQKADARAKPAAAGR